MNAKAIVFDFNGTLFFDYKENLDAWNIISKKYRGREFYSEEYDSLMGMTDPCVVRAMKNDVSDEEAYQIANEKEELYLKLCKERKLTLVKEAVEFIKYVQSLSIKTAIASSAPKGNMEWYYNNLGLDKLFKRDEIICDPPGLKSKPEPDIFRLALKIVGISAEDAICFEDSPGGLKAALRTPFKKTIAVLSPGMSEEKQCAFVSPISWSCILEHKEKIIKL